MDSTTKTKANEAHEKEPQGNGSFGAVEWLLGEIYLILFTYYTLIWKLPKRMGIDSIYSVALPD